MIFSSAWDGIDETERERIYPERTPRRVSNPGVGLFSPKHIAPAFFFFFFLGGGSLVHATSPASAVSREIP